MTALDVAKDTIGRDAGYGEGVVLEVAGSNRGPWIDEANHYVAIPMGSPYCAASVSLCFRKSELASPASEFAELVRFAKSGGSQTLKAKAKARGKLFTDPQKLLTCKGALFGWTNRDGAHGHIGFVGERLTEDGRVVAIGTWEFNTSPATMGRDGEGGYHLKRTIDALRAAHPQFWFIDVSDNVGGRWWT